MDHHEEEEEMCIPEFIFVPGGIMEQEPTPPAPSSCKKSCSLFAGVVDREARMMPRRMTRDPLLESFSDCSAVVMRSALSVASESSTLLESPPPSTDVTPAKLKMPALLFASVTKKRKLVRRQETIISPLKEVYSPRECSAVRVALSVASSRDGGLDNKTPQRTTGIRIIRTSKPLQRSRINSVTAWFRRIIIVLSLLSLLSAGLSCHPTAKVMLTQKTPTGFARKHQKKMQKNRITSLILPRIRRNVLASNNNRHCQQRTTPLIPRILRFAQRRNPFRNLKMIAKRHKMITRS